MSGYQALCLVQEDDGYYFSADSFIEEMRAIQFTGSCSKRKSILANWIIRKNYDSNDCRSNKTIQKNVGYNFSDVFTWKSFGDCSARRWNQRISACEFNCVIKIWLINQVKVIY